MANVVSARSDTAWRPTQARGQSVRVGHCAAPAQAVALAGREQGLETSIVMPENAPPVKVAAVEEYGVRKIPPETGQNSRPC